MSIQNHLKKIQWATNGVQTGNYCIIINLCHNYFTIFCKILHFVKQLFAELEHMTFKRLKEFKQAQRL